MMKLEQIHQFQCADYFLHPHLRFPFQLVHLLLVLHRGVPQDVLLRPLFALRYLFQYPLHLLQLQVHDDPLRHNYVPHDHYSRALRVLPHPYPHQYPTN